MARTALVTLTCLLSCSHIYYPPNIHPTFIHHPFITQPTTHPLTIHPSSSILHSPIIHTPSSLHDLSIIHNPSIRHPSVHPSTLHLTFTSMQSFSGMNISTPENLKTKVTTTNLTSVILGWIKSIYFRVRGWFYALEKQRELSGKIWNNKDLWLASKKWQSSWTWGLSTNIKVRAEVLST